MIPTMSYTSYNRNVTTAPVLFAGKNDDNLKGVLGEIKKMASRPLTLIGARPTNYGGTIITFRDGQQIYELCLEASRIQFHLSLVPKEAKGPNPTPNTVRIALNRHSDGNGLTIYGDNGTRSFSIKGSEAIQHQREITDALGALYKKLEQLATQQSIKMSGFPALTQ